MVNFSVVIPLYNKEQSISSTINSVLNQTYHNFELIVVNDGSTDNSLQVVSQIEDPRIRIIDKPNGGVSRARNRGVKEARYEWIAFLDADDLWRGNHLAEVADMMKLFPDEKVFTTSFEYSDGRKLFRNPRTSRIIKIENYYKEALNESLICSITIVLHKTCFDMVGGFNPKLSRGEDLDMWGRLAREYTIVKSSEVTALYRIDAENRSDSPHELMHSKVYYYDFQDLISLDEKKYYKKHIVNTLVNLVSDMKIGSFLKLYRRYFGDVSIYDVVKSIISIKKQNL